jgi:hypothetical protein
MGRVPELASKKLAFKARKCSLASIDNAVKEDDKRNSLLTRRCGRE